MSLGLNVDDGSFLYLFHLLPSLGRCLRSLDLDIECLPVASVFEDEDEEDAIEDDSFCC